MYLWICLYVYWHKLLVLHSVAVCNVSVQYTLKWAIKTWNFGEYQWCNQKWTIQRNWTHGTQNKTKTQHNMCWTPLYYEKHCCLNIMKCNVWTLSLALKNVSAIWWHQFHWWNNQRKPPTSQILLIWNIFKKCVSFKTYLIIYVKPFFNWNRQYSCSHGGHTLT